MWDKYQKDLLKEKALEENKSVYEYTHPWQTFWRENVVNPTKRVLNTITRVGPTINNAYPFGYTNSRDANVAHEILQKYPAIGQTYSALQSLPFIQDKLPPLNQYELGEAAGFVSKVAKGAAGYKTPAAKAAYAFADLDLDDPKNLQVADSLAKVMRKDEPRWGLRVGPGNYKRGQDIIRGRIDLNRLHTALPQKYDTYIMNDDYNADPEGKPYRTYVAKDPERRRRTAEAAKAFLRTHPNAYHMGGPNNDLRIYSNPGAGPYYDLSNYSIITDKDGSNPRYKDIWDFGNGGKFSSNNLPWATNPIYIGDYLD